MEKIFTTKNLVLRAAMLLAVLTGMTAENTTWANDEVTVGDVSNTPCANMTRGESLMEHSALKLTRFEGGLYGELKNCKVNCAYGNVKVTCQEDGQRLAINVDEGTGEGGIAFCTCPINISFTVFNATQETYQVTVRGQEIGTVSFKEHVEVEIDMETLEQAYEDGFDYPVKAQGFWLHEVTNSPNPDWDYSQKFELFRSNHWQLNCCYTNYLLPCEYTYLNVQADIDQDGTLVVNILTDGIPGQDCKRIANLNFDINNVPNNSYHLRLNHMIMTKSTDGAERARTFCLYEGDFTLQFDIADIPITDNNDYSALVTDIALQQCKESDSYPVYDLQGRRLTTQPMKGVYFSGGRKYVVK